MTLLDSQIHFTAPLRPLSCSRMHKARVMNQKINLGGLRERQRHGRRSRILAVARELFNAQGYEKTTLDEVAQQVELSPVTVVNYFGSKGALLLAIQTEFDHDLRRKVAPIILNPPMDPVLALNSFFKIVFDHALHTMDRPAWKHIWANLFLEAGTKLGQGFAANERELIEQLVVMLDTIKTRGHLRKDVDVPLLGEILYNLRSIRSMQFMSDQSISRRELTVTEANEMTLKRCKLAS
jgi:AcrR family transcriptional regulator